MRTFVTADTHFGHKGACTFAAANGVGKMRPWDTIEEMDEALVQRWNETVKPEDRVYVLGDVVINRRSLPTIARLNGRKTLVKGNHDLFRIEEYLAYFDDVRAVVGLKEMVLTHVPIHPCSIGRWVNNVHGHLHDRSVGDPRYLCVSVEQTDYRPITLEEVRERLQKQQAI
jgi:calcineurin-like phosphoesterase family protein